MTAPGSATPQQPQEPERRPADTTAPPPGGTTTTAAAEAERTEADRADAAAIGPPAPPGYPVQLYHPNPEEHTITPSNPAPWSPLVPQDDRPAPRRFTQFTRSPIGLVLGLVGVAVGAAFTYLLSVTPDAAGGAMVTFDPGRTLVLLRNLGQPAAFPSWEGPLVVLAPFLPLIQLVVVPLLSLPAARAVGPRLTSRARLIWLAFFLLVTGGGIAATVLGGPGQPLYLLHWLGSTLVVVALAVPHRPD
ncbi:hypothetical protein [Gandjariella thermophila]|uniref:Uncharacterized protein n=1 Tax=Gandjariella thermophila TaxID=1931992 RepID=A0A4D4J0K3_9PSEU|nr:hypothetical protein [Gandjariella thermophila]GDY30145.1 hypothetical protein GTS_17780 [Gandjariella thermophila]